MDASPAGPDAATAGPTAPALVVEALSWQAQPILTIAVDVAPTAADAELRAVYFRLIAAASRAGLELTGPPMAQVLERGVRVRLLAAVPVGAAPAPSALPAGVAASTLPPGPAVHTRHLGRHDQLPAVHEALRAWMQASGKRPRGAPWERYLTNPILEPDPAKQDTDVVWPIEP